MLHGLAGVLAAEWAVAIVASFSVGGGPSSDCNVDKKSDPGSATCERNGVCVNVECCLTEKIIPPHDELIPGNKRIKSDVKSKGRYLHRKCDPPYYFLGLTFGWWTCEIETITEFGEYHQYTLEPCPTPKDPGTSSGGGDIGMPE